MSTGRTDFGARCKRLVTGLITLGLLATNNLASAAPPDNTGGGNDLTAPSSLNASSVSSSQININWADSNSKEIGFEVERSPSVSGPFSLIASVGKNTSSYASTGLSSAAQYCYRVRATGRKGAVSAYSNTGCATTSSASGDTTAPTVSITSPGSGSTYTSAQTVTISASASDNVGVTQVRLYNGNTLKSIDSTAPYNYGWSITAADNGSHSWTARAYDAAGNLKTSSAVSLNVNITASDTTAPTVSITSPGSGSTYTSAQTVTINASASDNVGVTQVRFYDGSTWKGTDYSSPYRYNWSINEADNGSHSWTARAYDAAGNLKTSSAVGVTVDISSASEGGHLWSLAFGGETTADIAVSKATALDPSGDVFIAAKVSGSVDFGDGMMTTNKGGVLAKYSATGNPLWSALWTGAIGADLNPNAIAIDVNEQSVIVTGYFTGTVNFGGGSLTSAGGYDMFMVKYTSNGNHLWSRRFGASGSEVGNAVAVDPYGNLWVAGYVHGSGHLGGSTLTSGSRDAFLAKYSSYGDHILSRLYGGSSLDEGTGIAVDGSGNPVMTGYFQGAASFGGSTFNSAGSYDIFVAAFSNTGQHRWSRREGSTGRDQGRSIGVDGNGNVVLGAYFEGMVNIGGTTLSSNGYIDVALTKYSSSGSPLWARGLGGTSSDAINSVAVNNSGDIAITGTYISYIDMGGTYVFGDGSVNVYVARFSSGGAHVWSVGTSAPWDDYGYGVAIDSQGGVFATGSFYESVDFGGGPLVNSTLGSTDGYLVRFAP